MTSIANDECNTFERSLCVHTSCNLLHLLIHFLTNGLIAVTGTSFQSSRMAQACQTFLCFLLPAHTIARYASDPLMLQAVAWKVQTIPLY